MKTIRTFIAIDLPSAIKNIILEIQFSFKILNLKASWVKPENAHLTLKFLEVTPFKQLENIRNLLAQELQNLNPFQISLGGLEVFPNWNRPRVFWIGIKDKNQSLHNLWSLVGSQLEGVGFARNNKKFLPHLTLARIKSPYRKDQLQKRVAAWRPLSIEPFEATEVKLYKSQLTPQGSIYTVLETFPFRKP